MKKLFFSLCIFCGFLMNAQSGDSTSVKPIRLNPVIRINGYYPMATGDNMLSKSYRPNFGVGYNMSMVTIYGFRPGIGVNRASYSLKDPSMGGDFQNANFTSLYFMASYEVDFGSDFGLYPEVGLGYAWLNQRTGSVRKAEMEGLDLRVGLMADYKFTDFFSIYTGVTYEATTLDTRAHASVKDYFSQARQVQFCLGFQFEAKSRKSLKSSGNRK